MPKLPSQHLSLTHETFVMRGLAREREVTAALEVTVDPLADDELLDAVDRIHRRFEKLPGEMRWKAIEQSASADFEPGQHHAAVAGTGAPANRLRFQQNHIDTALGERPRCVKTGNSAADHHDIGTLRQGRRLQRWHGYGVSPRRAVMDLAD